MKSSKSTLSLAVSRILCLGLLCLFLLLVLSNCNKVVKLENSTIIKSKMLDATTKLQVLVNKSQAQIILENKKEDKATSLTLKKIKPKSFTLQHSKIERNRNTIVYLWFNKTIKDKSAGAILWQKDNHWIIYHIRLQDPRLIDSNKDGIFELVNATHTNDEATKFEKYYFISGKIKAQKSDKQ